MRAEVHRAAGLTRVLVTVPNTGWVHRHCALSLLRLQIDGRYKLRLQLPSRRPLEHNQQLIVEDFLRGGEDYWLSIDSDVTPIQNPLDLVELDKDIIGCPTPIWHHDGEKPLDRPVYWGIYDYVPDEDAYREYGLKKGLQRVSAISGSCFVVARRVFEHPEMRTGSWLRKYKPNGSMERGNDISFCERASSAGFEIWAHFDYPCLHFKELELTEVITAFSGMKP